MKKFFILCLLSLLILSLGSCTLVKINRFSEFASSNAMDISITKYSEDGNIEISLKYNEELMIVDMEGMIFTLDFINDLVFLDMDGSKVYASYNLDDFKSTDDEETNYKDYISDIKSEEEYLSFELNKNQLLIDQGKKTPEEEPEENVICKVLFEEKKVSTIEVLPLESDQPDYLVTVNAYGEDVVGLECPSKDDYETDVFISLFINVILNGLKERF